MKSFALGVLVGIIIEAVVYIIIATCHYYYPPYNPTELDSLQVLIDTNYVEKSRLQEEFKQSQESIYNQSFSADSIYFFDFLRSRYCIDSTTTKAN